MIKTVLKIVDLMVFIVFGLLAYQYHATAPYVFDIVTITAMIYVMVRNPDVNTVSLISIVISVRLLAASVLYLIGEDKLNPYLFYMLAIVFNLMMVAIVMIRPLLLFRHGPKCVRGHEGLTITHQDAMIAWFYRLQALLPALTLFEHIIRHFDWFNFKPMLFYTIYQPVQLGLSTLALLVLYLMTYPKSAEARKQKATGQSGSASIK